MRSRSLNLSLLVTIIAIVVAYLFTAGYIVNQLTGMNVSQLATSSVELKALFANNSSLLMLLAVPAAYCCLVLLAIVYHNSSSPLASRHRHAEYIETVEDTRVLDANKLVHPMDLSDEKVEPVLVTTPILENPPERKNMVTSNNQPLVERLKKDLVIAEEQLVRAQKSKSQFLANMSHELRTPMNGILGMTELLMGSGLERKQMHFADSARRSAESLLSVINDLLDFSRMEAGSIYLEKASFNMRELIEDVCDLHAVQAQLKGVELICHIDRAMHDQLIGDANRIRQLLNNLISNAVKFTKEGEVVVRVKQTEFGEELHSYTIDVIDTGVGISPEGQARIFDSFTQADNSNSREFGGSGLGLFISHKLLEMMGGKISLKSRMGEGSHFTVSLNLKPAASEVDSLNLLETFGGVRVLVVDDNETNRTILFHQLKSWGIDPDTVGSAALALEALKLAIEHDRPFEVAILDLHMPVTDGIELTRLIQQDPELRSLKRMMLTSATLDMTDEELQQIGISQYISKPARQSQLYTALSTLVPASRVRSADAGDDTQMFSFKPLKYSVLLAEDNILNQEVALNMLENFGCQVEVVTNGQAALEACEKKKFDIIMMDCSMPVVSGIEATKRLRSSEGINAETPVLALTANVSTDDEKICLESGMNEYICKPVKQNELYRRLSRWSETIHSHNIPTSTAHKSQTVTQINTSEEASKVIEKTQVLQQKSINETAIENIRRLQRPGKPDLVNKVVGVYLEKSPRLISSIIESVEKNDYGTIKEAAHSLKSSTAYVGADQMAEHFKKIEQAAIQEDIDDLAFYTRDLEAKYQRLVVELEPYRDRAA